MNSPDIKKSDAYEEIKVIGVGAYGTVFKAKDKEKNTYVALKKVKVPLTEDGIPMNTLREIALLKQLDTHEHPNVVRLLDICHGKRLEKENALIMFLVFEHVDQDLAMYMEKAVKAGGIPSTTIREMSRQILNGVDFLHSHRIVHRDLKPQNLLVTSAGDVKLADFGLAKTYDFDMRLTSVVVTLWYRAPEVLLGQPYATPVDIWAVGCIIAELYQLRALFCGSSEGDQLARIFKILGKPREKEWPTNVSIDYNSFDIPYAHNVLKDCMNLCENGFDLIMKMLQFDPLQRISAAGALKHVYFTEEPLNT